MTDFRDRLTQIGISASSSKLGGIFYHVVCRRIDTVLIPLSRGRLSMGPPGQTLLLTTRGAKTGKTRKAALAFLWHGEEMVIVASKGGAPRHPAWYYNVIADPHVTVEYPGTIEERIAREASGEERAQLFDRMADAFGTFEAYQARATERTLPVIVLDRV